VIPAIAIAAPIVPGVLSAGNSSIAKWLLSQAVTAGAGIVKRYEISPRYSFLRPRSVGVFGSVRLTRGAGLNSITVAVRLRSLASRHMDIRNCPREPKFGQMRQKVGPGSSPARRRSNERAGWIVFHEAAHPEAEHNAQGQIENVVCNIRREPVAS